MSNYFKDNDDLQYYFEKGIDWDSLVQITEKDFKDEGGFSSTQEAVDFYRGVAEMLGGFVAEEIAPHAAQIDREGVRFEDGEAVFPERLASIFQKIKELDLHGLCIPRELGGMNAPLLLYYINSEIMARADVSVMAHHGFHGGIAMAALVLSLKEGTTKVDGKTGRIVETRFREAIEEIASGEAWGCMDITEPDAGSDMASLRAIGEQDASGQWYVTGEKIFITSGHGKWHFVIARTEAAAPNDPGGLEGLSMFLVPTYTEDERGRRKRIVELSRVEEKLGHHGSATCGLVFDRAPAFLVGKRGEGFKYMLVLMNNARLGVGFECLGLCEAALRLAKEYTAGRRSMGKSIDRHEMIADYLDEAEADIVGIRAMAMKGAYHEELAQKLTIALEHHDGLADEERRRYEREVGEHKAAARRITPLLKYFAAEKAVEISRRCIQLHGGNGYMTEYGAEKLLRDALVMPIYEGTSQIQSLMAMKDTLLGIMKNPQEFVRSIAQARWRQVSARDPLEKRVARLQHLALNGQQFLLMKTAGDKMKGLRDRPITEWAEQLTRSWDPKRDFAFAMLHAERLTQMLVDLMIAELLLEQAQKHEERAPLLERHLDRAEIRSRYLYEVITSYGRRLLDELAEGDPEARADKLVAE